MAVYILVAMAANKRNVSQGAFSLLPPLETT